MIRPLDVAGFAIGAAGFAAEDGRAQQKTTRGCGFWGDGMLWPLACEQLGTCLATRCRGAGLMTHTQECVGDPFGKSSARVC